MSESTSERGYDLLVSEDGVNFEVVTRDGMGDPYNHGCRVFAITDSGLCIGTANPFYGTQVWLLDDNALVGDLDFDGEITVVDATILQRDQAGIEKIKDDVRSVCDFNGDGVIDIIDSTFIQRFIAGFDDDKEETLLGDVDFDGEVTIIDATMIQRDQAKIEYLSAEAYAVADYNEDGEVNVIDVTAIQRMIAGY